VPGNSKTAGLTVSILPRWGKRDDQNDKMCHHHGQKHTPGMHHDGWSEPQVNRMARAHSDCVTAGLVYLELAGMYRAPTA